MLVSWLKIQVQLGAGIHHISAKMKPTLAHQGLSVTLTAHPSTLENKYQFPFDLSPFSWNL